MQCPSFLLSNPLQLRLLVYYISKPGCLILRKLGPIQSNPSHSCFHFPFPNSLSRPIQSIQSSPSNQSSPIQPIEQSIKTNPSNPIKSIRSIPIQSTSFNQAQSNPIYPAINPIHPPTKSHSFIHKPLTHSSTHHSLTHPQTTHSSTNHSPTHSLKPSKHTFKTNLQDTFKTYLTHSLTHPNL